MNWIAEVALVVVALLAFAGTVSAARTAKAAAIEAAAKAAAATAAAAEAAAEATREAADAAAAATVKAAAEAAAVAREGSEPDRLQALGQRYDDVLDRMDRQDETIAALRSEVAMLRERIRYDTEERHSLKTSIIYLVTAVIRPLIAAVIRVFTDEHIRGLPEPVRKHVLDREDFEKYLDLARPRPRTDT